MCFGPGSWMTGVTTGRPHVGSEVKSFEPQVWSESSSRSPPPCRWPPPATIRPLSGIVKSALREIVENIGPVPGTSKIGSARQFFTSSQYGFTGVSCSPVT